MFKKALYTAAAAAVIAMSAVPAMAATPVYEHGYETEERPQIDPDSVVPGATVKFGSYGVVCKYEEFGIYYDNAIEWIVLENNGDTATLISKYVLDAVPYNDQDCDVTWETCSLRQWLNNDFLNAAFTPEEQEKIAVTAVKAPQRLCMQGCTREDFPWLSDEEITEMLTEGNDTQDRVYLFSLDELLHYFPEKDSRACLATQYAVTRGAEQSKYDRPLATSYWTRSNTRRDDSSVTYVGITGDYDMFYGHGVTVTFTGVRPVINIKLQ